MSGKSIVIPILERFSASAEKIGIGLRSHQELVEASTGLVQAMRSKEGLGLSPLDTGVESITEVDWEKVEVGVVALVGAFAGTNWVVGVGKKLDDGGVEFTELIREAIIAPAEKERTFDEFVELMDTYLSRAVIMGEKDGVFNRSEVVSVGISLGFPHQNYLEEGDVDTRFTKGVLTKGWVVTDYDDEISLEEQPLVGKRLKEVFARDEKCFIKPDIPLVIVNDTHALEGDVDFGVEDWILAIGAVFGTGINAFVDGYNFELGATELVFDEVIARMQEKKLISGDRKYGVENVVGGVGLNARLRMALEILSEKEGVSELQEVADALMKSDSEMVSKIAAGAVKISKEISSVPFPDIDMWVRKLAQGVMLQAGENIGLLCYAAAVVSGWDGCSPALINTEGGVIEHGWGVKDKALEVMAELSEEKLLGFREASGLNGVAKMSLVNAFKDR